VSVSSTGGGVGCPKPPSEPPSDSCPSYHQILEGDILWRIYARAHHLTPAPHTVSAQTFRYYGPLPQGRFDHHSPAGESPGPDGKRGIYYAGEKPWDCLIEVSSPDGVVKIVNQYIADLVVSRDLLLLDLRDDGAEGIYADATIAKTGERELTQEWARYIYDNSSHFGQGGLPVDGLIYRNAHNEGLAVALFERAEGSLLVHNNDPLSTPTIRTAIDLVVKRWPRIRIET
jgi:RES domain